MDLRSFLSQSLPIDMMKLLKVFRKRKGFSLIEVLIALSLFGVAAIVFSQSFISYLNFSKRYERNLDSGAVFIDWSLRQILKERDLEKLKKGGSFVSFDEDKLEWAFDFEETEILDLFKVLIDVDFHPSDDDKKAISFSKTFYLYRPEFSQEESRNKLLMEKINSFGKKKEGSL